MRVIANELKKMWRVKILVLIVALCGLYFVAFLYDWIRLYPRGTWVGALDIAHHMTEHYGTTLERDDFESFLTLREAIIRDLDLFVQSSAFFNEIGAHSFEELEYVRQQLGSRYESLSDDELRKFHDIALELGYIVRTRDGVFLTSENETPISYHKLRSFENVESHYRNNILGEFEWPSFIEHFMEWHALSDAEYRRLVEIRDSTELLNVLAYDTTERTWRYVSNLAVLVVLVTLILTAPLVSTDRANRVNWLQYTSKQGRSILKKQFIAVLISAIAMTTILVGGFIGILLITTQSYVFWHSGINSFMSPVFHWFSLTFGQYMLFMAGVMYALSIGTASVAFGLSRFSSSLIKLLFKIVPFFIAVLLFSNWIFSDFLVIVLGGDVFVQMISLVLALALGMIVSLVIVQRERKIDIR